MTDYAKRFADELVLIELVDRLIEAHQGKWDDFEFSVLLESAKLTKEEEDLFKSRGEEVRLLVERTIGFKSVATRDFKEPLLCEVPPWFVTEVLDRMKLESPIQESNQVEEKLKEFMAMYREFVPGWPYIASEVDSILDGTDFDEAVEDDYSGPPQQILRRDTDFEEYLQRFEVEFQYLAEIAMKKNILYKKCMCDVLSRIEKMRKIKEAIEANRFDDISVK